MTNDEPTYVLDSFALLALFLDEQGAGRVDELLRQAEEGKIRLAMSVVNLGEVIYRTIRELGMDEGDRAQARIAEFTIEFIDVDRKLALEAAHLKGFYRMSYADCIAAALGQRLDAPIVTGDPDFKQLEGRVAIDWLSGIDGD